jgi:hypothetical protein
MNAGSWIALLGALLGAVLTVAGWAVGHLLTRLRTLEELVSTQRDIIADLKDQRNGLRITAEIQDRFFSVVPKLPSGGIG